MEQSRKNTIHTIGAIFGIFAAIFAIIGVALAGFAYIDNTYAKKTPDELQQVIKNHKEKLKTLSENNQKEFSDALKSYKASLDLVLADSGKKLQKENDNLKDLLEQNKANLDNLVNSKTALLDDLLSQKEKEMKRLLFTIEAVSGKSKSERDRMFNEYLSGNLNKRVSLYLDEHLAEVLDAYLNKNLSPKVNAYLDKNLERYMKKDMVSILNDELPKYITHVQQRKTIRLVNSALKKPGIVVERPFTYFKSITNNVYIDGKINVDTGKISGTTNLFKLEAIKLHRSKSIKHNVQISGGAYQRKLEINIDETGTVNVQYTGCCDGNIVLDFNNTNVGYQTLSAEK